MKIGNAFINIDAAVEAGSFQNIVYTFEAEHAIDDSGYIKIVFRFAGDFGTPQFENPAEADFCSVSTDADCHIEPRWDPKGHTRPWGKALYLKITKGFLNSGEKISVIFGDTTQGSPGWRIQTFCEDSFEFKTLVDPFATYHFKELPESPTMKIISGDAVKAVCIAPSQIVINTKFTSYLRLEDNWGNAVSKAIACEQPGFKECGIYTVECIDIETNLKAISNPIEVTSEIPVLSHWWADFHAQSEETIGTNSIEEYFSYARYCSMVDIVSHQGNDFQITDEFWDKINQTTKKYYEPGTFVTFPGYEWSGNTPLGGDRNIYHKEEGGSIYRSSHDLLPNEYSKYQPAPTADKLFSHLKSDKSFAFAHVGGRYADVIMHSDDVEIAMEIHSAWGTFKWLVDDAFKLGHRIGICANSDGHKCRPGASYPGASTFGSYGGLTCVLAKELKRESIFEAMKARHFYATTGNRILLDLAIITADGQKGIMGDILEVDNGAPQLNVKINATAPIDYVEIYNGVEVIKTIRPYKEKDLKNEIKIVWSGAEVQGRDRKCSWNGTLKIVNNNILSFSSFNFWNPDSQPNQKNNNEISWSSITTGGIAGVILKIENPDEGDLQIKTEQIDCNVSLASVGINPLVYDGGGIEKKLEIYRLPQKSKAKHDFNFSLPIENLKNGDNPIYVKVVQRDGHMAWSSPVYLVCSK